ncbi:AI-2E family transporter [Candidatus Sororendozoicomonas aggregata]|uniref:AI-2E family transporter n=1 Tax=Candidatus Sororendozoicomonas aggregata TaxID=3073239 RepID=UPI002ED00EFA
MTNQQRWMLLAVVVSAGLVVHFLGPVLAPFIISMVLAYLGDPLADRLEELGLSRTLSVTTVFMVVLVVFVLVILVVVPLLFQQIKAVIQLLPVWEIWLRTHIWPWAQQAFNIDPNLFNFSEIAKNLASEWQQASITLAKLGGSFTRSSIALAGFMVNLFLVPVVTFYLLRDWDTMVYSLRTVLPRNIEPVVVTLSRECDDVLAAFLKGQLMVMLALSIIYSAGLSLIGLKFAVLIGLLAGLFSIIPYMGFIVGFIAALLVALFQFGIGWTIGSVALVFAVGQALEGWILTPYLVGDRIGLHPVAVIFALMAGGQLFGFVGMLIALPLAAIIMVLLRHLHRNYRESTLYHAD